MLEIDLQPASVDATALQDLAASQLALVLHAMKFPAAQVSIKYFIHFLFIHENFNIINIIIVIIIIISIFE